MQHTNLQHLRQLKLTGMANALSTQHEQPGQNKGLSFDERLQLPSDAEQLERDQRKQARLLKAAKFKLHATAQGTDYSHSRGLKQSVMASLCNVIGSINIKTCCSQGLVAVVKPTLPAHWHIRHV